MKMKKVVRMPLRRPPQRTRPPAASMRARAATVDEAYDEEDYEGEEEPQMNFWHAVLVVLALHFIAVAGIFAFTWIKNNQTNAVPPTASVTAPAPSAATSGPPAPQPAASVKSSVPDATIAGWTGKTYAIQPGDTLTRVATQFGITIPAIEKENNITTYSTLRVGQVLKIPAPGAPETKPAAPVAKSEPPASVKSSGTIASVPKPAAPATVPKAAAAAAPKPAAPASAPAGSPDIYVVAKGDNPYTIAKKHHVSYKALLDLNDIKDATKIQIGQKLKIPQKTN